MRRHEPRISAVVSNLTIFQGLNDSELSAVCKQIHERSLNADEVIIREGDSVENVFIITTLQFLSNLTRPGLEQALNNDP